MQTAAHITAGVGARANSARPGVGASRPWSAHELLWLRVVKSPEDGLRPCDWAFLQEHLGRRRPEIRRQLASLGLIPYGRRYLVDEEFFDAWSASMAWVLGLLLSDGHFSKDAATILLSSTDWELTEKARACLGSTHPIRVSVGGVGHLGEKPVHILAINRQRLRQGADALLPARLKEQRWKLPDVPDAFLSHFVRGYFEGDGNIFLDERRNLLHVQVSGTTSFIADLRLRVQGAGLRVPPSLYRCPQAEDTSTLHFSGAQAFRFADFLYHDADPALTLERKRAVYLRCVESRRARGLELLHAI